MEISMNEYTSSLLCIDVSGGVRRVHSVSGGNQCKWILSSQNIHVKSSYFSDSMYWKDYVCEGLAYKIGIQLGIDVVPNKACLIDTGDQNLILGSYSELFTSADEEFISMAKLLDSVNISWDRLATIDRILSTIDLYKNMCGVEAIRYIVDMITLDYLIGNVDRHFGNFGIVRNTSGKYRLPPHFDNGLSLFEFDKVFQSLTLEESMNRLYAQPFGDYFQEVHAATKQLYTDSPVRLCCLEGIVFPSKKALDYFNYVANQLSIPLSGEATWIRED